ncbi:QueT transporter family protein [Halopenitus persicus]|uniref:Energy-coupling factor transport system substrate-specific component n=1 Tax=Halopenitus persicus TaxID=1048396 RepID=A0A1H3J212_9EURY|nr:QueT transporter family protein [Halopenitus persicus]SDY33971.1 energy-coupling factor transport system substrate-specific component [Halopenitus persicus]
MREIFTMWRDTRMIMLVAVVAAVYAAVLIPFQTFQIIPGITSIRPANVFPVIFGIMFGPAAAWGSAIGNLIGDIFGGTFGPGSVGGFIGNFTFGLLGYKLWGNLTPLSSRVEPDFRENAGVQLAEYVVIAVAASAACAVIISWVVDLLGLVPFAVLGPTILINNTIAAVVLGPPLLYLTYPRLKEMGLLYPDLLRAEDLSSAGSNLNPIAAWGLVVVPLVWLGVGFLLSTGAGAGLTSVTALGAVGIVVLAACAVIVGERLSTIVGRA